MVFEWYVIKTVSALSGSIFQCSKKYVSIYSNS